MDRMIAEHAGSRFVLKWMLREHVAMLDSDIDVGQFLPSLGSAPDACAETHGAADVTPRGR